MPKMTEYEKVGPEFLADPAKCGSFEADIPVDAATLFEALKSEDAWKAMLPLDKAEWHGPLGPKVTRTMGANGAEMLEQFFEWEEGRSFAFRLERGTVGILKALAERYEVLPVSENQSKIRTTYRIQCKGLAKPLGPVFMALFKFAGRKSMKNLAEYLAGKT